MDGHSNMEPHQPRLDGVAFKPLFSSYGSQKCGKGWTGRSWCSAGNREEAGLTLGQGGEAGGNSGAAWV